MKEINQTKYFMKRISIPQGIFHSSEKDWFICSSCGYERMIITIDNRIDCPECGGSRTMLRQD